MNTTSKRLFVATVLAAAASLSMAQAPATPAAGGPGAGPGMGRMEHGDPAKRHAAMAERQAKHQAELKEKLKITPAQEGAWNNFTQSMKPPATPPQRPNREEMAKLTTPERLDRMQAMKAQRDAEMGKRTEAVKSFYGQLNAEQKKVFDSETARMGERHGRGGRHGGGHGGMHGMHGKS